MANVQHTMNSQEHYTPLHIIEMAREVLGGINLDPCSSAIANKTVGAEIFYNEIDEPLSMDWRIPPNNEVGTVWCNPPGSRYIRPSLPMQFFQKLWVEIATGNVSHALYLAYSLEQLQQCQHRGFYSMLDFSLCIPRKRIAFLDTYGYEQKSPTHANAIVYIPGTIDATAKFKEVFSTLGCVKV
ncbi:hypothetical protein [Nostoc sp.]|uniref:hypothetical protein n=1 Tax=Nostoc sp. TaxID=1180 RepID=UPI002FF81C0E